MAREKTPAFQFYPREFTGDHNVAAMTTEEVGAYILLLSYCWSAEALDDDMEALAGIARMPVRKFTQAWDRRIAKCFTRSEDGRWRHARLDAERAKQQAFRDKQRARADARWGGGPGNAAGMPRHPSGIDSASPRDASGIAAGVPDGCSPISDLRTTSEDPPVVPLREPAKARRGRPSSLDAWRAQATALWETQERLRAWAIPKSRRLEPDDERLERVADRLSAGRTVADCEHVLRVYAGEARKDPASAKWFNGETNWIAKNFERVIGYPAPDGVPLAAAASSTPARPTLSIFGGD